MGVYFTTDISNTSIAIDAVKYDRTTTNKLRYIDLGGWLQPSFAVHDEPNK